MRNGEIVEESGIDAIRARQVAHDYSRSMLLATGGYQRKAAEAIGIDTSL
jgi:peptide/nickel transport system ATP-binding protein